MLHQVERNGLEKSIANMRAYAVTDSKGNDSNLNVSFSHHPWLLVCLENILELHTIGWYVVRSLSFRETAST